MCIIYEVYLLSAATRTTAKETSPPKKGEQADKPQPSIGNYTSHKYSR